MLQIRTPLGQYPQAPYGYQPIDPLVDASLVGAGLALAPGDPGAPETMRLIRRIIVAPPFMSFGGTSGGPLTSRKLSDLNPELGAVAWVKENQGLAAMLVLSVPVIAFLLGRSTRR